MISAAQSVFINQLSSRVRSRSQSLDAAQVIAVGATDLREFFSESELEDILDSYLIGVRDTWVLAVTCACVAFASAFLAKL